MDERIARAGPLINDVGFPLDLELVPKSAETASRFRVDPVNSRYQAG